MRQMRHGIYYLAALSRPCCAHVQHALALPVMRHRMGLNFAAQSEGVKTDDVIRKLLEEIPSDEKMYQAKSA